MINKPLFKIICLCSIITGGIVGIFPLIPALTSVAFLAVMFLIAPFILIYFKNLNILKELNMEQSIAISAISGATAFLGFAVVYFPIAFILNLIFKIKCFIWIKVIFSNIGFLVPMVILTALLCALTNAFSGFLTVYFYQYLKQKR